MHSSALPVVANKVFIQNQVFGSGVLERVAALTQQHLIPLCVPEGSPFKNNPAEIAKHLLGDPTRTKILACISEIVKTVGVTEDKVLAMIRHLFVSDVASQLELVMASQNFELLEE